jgi:hypothetical protein
MLLVNGIVRIEIYNNFMELTSIQISITFCISNQTGETTPDNVSQWLAMPKIPSQIADRHQAFIARILKYLNLYLHPLLSL